MTQILVTGMHRSGTTLCFDLVRRHRDVGAEINEGVLFERASGRLMEPPFPSNRLDASSPRPGTRAGERTWVKFPRDAHDMSWVAKMSYPGPVILQEWCDSAVRYVDCWLKEFGTRARVIHMIRHPFAVFQSVHRRWAADPIHLTNYGPISLEAVCRDWSIAVTQVDRVISDDDRVLTVLYEDLVTEPSIWLKSILEHCRLRSDAPMVEFLLKQDIAFFGKVDASRANSHRTNVTEPISRSTSWLMTPLFKKFKYGEK